jgi:hypothetical protein
VDAWLEKEAETGGKLDTEADETVFGRPVAMAAYLLMDQHVRS